MNKILLIIIGLTIVSCNNKTIYDQYDRDFDDNRWYRSDVRQYNFEVDTIGHYDFIVDFSHVAGFQFGLIPVKVELKSPNTATVTEHILLRIKDREGNDRGDCTGDYCDIEEMVFSKKSLKRGSYSITLTNEFNNDYLPNVIGLGLRVQHSKNVKLK